MKVGRNFFFVLSVLFACAASAEGPGVTIDVKLSPAGSFKAQTNKVTGTAKKVADGVVAQNIEVDIESIKTGVGLRDKHLKQRLMSDKYPKAKLLKAQGKGGKGAAMIEVKGMKKKVSGTYSIEGQMLKAQFKMLLSDLDIKDVRYMGIGAKDEVTVTVNVPIK